MQPSTPMIFCGMLLFDVLQPAQGAVDLVLGVLADAARVEQDRVGPADAVDQLVAGLEQAGRDQLAVEHVHLAADGFDVEATRHAGEMKMRDSRAADYGGDR